MIHKSQQDTHLITDRNCQWQSVDVPLPVLLTHYQTTNFRLFQLKEFADGNFKFDENGRNVSKWVENTVGKGEISRYEQFLLFPQCFQKACFPGASKGVIVWEWVKAMFHFFFVTHSYL